MGRREKKKRTIDGEQITEVHTHTRRLGCTQRCTVGRTGETKDPQSEQEPGQKTIRGINSQRHTPQQIQEKGEMKERHKEAESRRHTSKETTQNRDERERKRERVCF